jgi:hypothetical protein
VTEVEMGSFLNIFLILWTIYIVIPVSGCIGKAPVHCFGREAYNAVKTALRSSINQ